VWELVEGTANGPLHLQSGDYQCRVDVTGPGHYKLRCSPRPDARDAEDGTPLETRGDASTYTEWDIQ
jgi:hypothetical protein